MLAGEGFRTVDHTMLVVRAGAVVLETHCSRADRQPQHFLRPYGGSAVQEQVRKGTRSPSRPLGEGGHGQTVRGKEERRHTPVVYHMARRSSSPRGTATGRSLPPTSAPSFCPGSKRSTMSSRGASSIWGASGEHHEIERGLQGVRLEERQQALERGWIELALGCDRVKDLVRDIGGSYGRVAAYEALCAAGSRVRVSGADRTSQHGAGAEHLSTARVLPAAHAAAARQGQAARTVADR